MAGSDSRVRQPAFDAARGIRILRHLDGVAGRLASLDAERRQQVPLIQDGVSCGQISGPWHDVGVHPAAARGSISDPDRRPARPGEPGTSGPAVEVDGDIECRAPQPTSHSQIVTQSAQTRVLRDFNNRIDVRIAADDRSGGWFDEVSKMPGWIAPPECSYQRGREDDVADQAQANQEDLHSFSIVASSISITGMSSLIG